MKPNVVLLRNIKSFLIGQGFASETLDLLNTKNLIGLAKEYHFIAEE